MSQATLSTTGGALLSEGVAGQVADLEVAQIISRVNGQATALDFGVAAFWDVNDPVDQCRVQNSSSDLFLGLTVRHPTMTSSSDYDTLSTVNYATGKSVPLLIDGVMFVQAAETVKARQQAYAIRGGGSGNSSAGALGSIEGGATSATRLALLNVVWLDNVTSGNVGKVRVKSIGDYTTAT